MPQKLRSAAKAEIKKSKLTQQEVAERSGMTPAHLSRYLNGKADLSTAMLVALWAALDRELKAVKRSLKKK